MSDYTPTIAKERAMSKAVTSPDNPHEARYLHLMTNPRTATTSTTMSMIEENEALKSELIALKAELARYNNNNGLRLSDRTPLHFSPTRMSSPLHAPLNSPLKSRGIPPSPLSLGGINFRPSVKVNRHPSSDDLLGTYVSSNESDSINGRASIQNHESARGLKHRKHNINSPIYTPIFDRPSPPASVCGTINSQTVASAKRCNNVVHISKDSERTRLVDVEADSCAKEHDDGSTLPPTPDTAAISVASAESFFEFEVSTFENRNIALPSFFTAIKDRAGWLVGLLILQSMSSFIISRNERLLQNHLVIVRFLTMLVGAGGNAGNQASVGVIRGLAIGSIHEHNVRLTLLRELRMALGLSCVMGIAGAFRVAVFLTPVKETVAVTICLISIVFISILFGAILPLIMKFCGVDPAHSSTSIQVIMDILGVLITVQISGYILDGQNWLSSLIANST